MSLYIHIPFCRSKCRYCGFYSAPYEGALSFAYCDTLASQIDALHGDFRTIYIGGGTPSALDMGSLKKILLSLKRFSRGFVEFTVEANPESLTPEKLSLFMDEGVNRISIGIQSFNDDKLKRLGRLHDGSGALGAVKNARKAGFANIGIDLIFGVWDEDALSWKDDLRKATDLPVTHISCYGLTYEAGTSIKDRVEKGSIIPVSDDVCADMYNEAISFLADKGFTQYEISNFARPGFSCKHNNAYWNNDPYTGLGPSAVSYVNGARIENIPDVVGYIDKVKAGLQPIVSSEELPPEARAKETAAIKIRTMDGINFEWFKKKTGFDLRQLETGAIAKLITDGLIEYDKDGSAASGVRLTKRGVLFCDTVSGALL